MKEQGIVPYCTALCIGHGAPSARSLVVRLVATRPGSCSKGLPDFCCCFPRGLSPRAVAPVPSQGGAAAGGGGRGGRTGRCWEGGRWARPVGIPGPTSSGRGRPTQLEEAAAAAATMSSGDAVCTGWLVKSPPERKLQRYVSRGAARPPSRSRVPTRGGAPGSPGVLCAPKAAAPSARVCRQGRSTESEIARRAKVQQAGRGPVTLGLRGSAAPDRRSPYHPRRGRRVGAEAPGTILDAEAAKETSLVPCPWRRVPLSSIARRGEQGRG